MLGWIKGFINWPTGGLTSGKIAWEWMKGSWIQIGIFLFVALIIFMVVKRLVGWLISAIKD